MGKLVVVAGARLQCTMGTLPSELVTTAGAVVSASGTCMPVASIFDHLPVVNIPPFGGCLCKKPQPQPCSPLTFVPWQGGRTSTLLALQPTLAEDGRLTCAEGGTIRIADPGQHDIEIEDTGPLPEPESESEDDDGGGILGFVHGALTVGGFVPGLGAAPDLVDAGIYALEGKWDDAAFSAGAAIPLAGDAAKGGKLAAKALGKGGKEAAQKATKKAAQKAAKKPPKYAPSPKHQRGGHGTLMDLDDETAATVLEKSHQSGKQRYGIHNGKPYEFQPDNVGGYHGYPVNGTEVPPEVLKKWRDDGTISNSEYNKLRKGKR